MLAAKLVQNQGLHVAGLNFFTGFCVEGHTHSILSRSNRKPRRNNALWVAEQLNIPLYMIDVIEEYKSIVLHPRHGYGANLNPCLDCKSFMVKKALEWMHAHEFDFIITGEVVGQRPMSQRRDTFPVVARESGANDRLLRPLCAQLQPLTLPEREGWVDRAQLHGFSGRGRKAQIALAEQLGLKDYAQPAGGCCFLTDAAYSRKLRDLWRNRDRPDYDIDDIMLLKVGRHLRPRPHLKVIVARDAGETRYLRGYRRRFTCLDMTSHNGPLTLVEGEQNDEDLDLAARIAARYGQGRHEPMVRFQVLSIDGREREICVTPLRADEVPRSWYL